MGGGEEGRGEGGRRENGFSFPAVSNDSTGGRWGGRGVGMGGGGGLLSCGELGLNVGNMWALWKRSGIGGWGRRERKFFPAVSRDSKSVSNRWGLWRGGGRLGKGWGAEVGEGGGGEDVLLLCIE